VTYRRMKYLYSNDHADILKIHKDC